MLINLSLLHLAMTSNSSVVSPSLLRLAEAMYPAAQIGEKRCKIVRYFFNKICHVHQPIIYKKIVIEETQI
jgi:hypothetical protein